MTRPFHAAVPLWAMFLAAPGQLCAQDQPAPRQAQAESAPQKGVQPLKATAIEVVGDVKTAPSGTSPLAADAWKVVKVNDELEAGTLIRTGLRSHLTLQFGDDTVVSIRRVTLASIDAFYKTETTKTARLGLGYGAVRGGSSEGTLRSELVIDSTVATLAKRGTEGFEMSVEPYTGRFAISLAREGLVDALEKATGQRRLVRPGEYVNDVNIARMWIRQDQFDRKVTFYATEAMTSADLERVVASPRGFAVVAPAAGFQTAQFSRPPLSGPLPDRFVQQFSVGLANRPERLPDIVVFEAGPVRRPEGNFGVSPTVRVRVPDFDLGQFSESIQKRFRRADLGRALTRGHRHLGSHRP